jgi:succinate-semialdehyde dehydrogenase/glutarate-semialdehyde dehydrogenase
VAVSEDAVIGAVPRGLFVSGVFEQAKGGKVLAVEDPATGEVLCEVADASAEDAVKALDAAVDSSRQWASTPPRARAEILRSAFEAVIKKAEELALLMTLEMGKPLAESRGEVAYAAEFLRWFSEEASRIRGDFYVSPDGSSRVLTQMAPVGPSYLITPWNFPLAMATRKLAPALAAGCTVVLKPAEQTPLCSLALADIFNDVGLPAGVLNVITTSTPGAVSDVLLADTRLRKLSFTGSTEVGRLLMSKASRNLLRLSMELGGNAPFIVFSDADLEKAVKGAMLAKMRNMGEACTSANRILVQREVAADFADMLADHMSKLKVARGTEPDSQVGPLIDSEALNKVDRLVADAVGLGAQITTGAERLGSKGYFYAPTVLRGVPKTAAMFKEEIFGPIAPIYEFDSEEQAIALANDTDYGLVSYVFSESLSRVHRVLEGLETGMIGVNQGLVSNAAAPFGGVKHSGFGREGGFEGIKEYLSVKYAALNIG